MTIALMRSEAFSSAAGRSASAAVSRAFAFVFEALERQRTRRDLAGLDDRMLQDIGISRYEVQMELRRPWWRR
jgi:uncharacterized protein YjiS (DUF1127 family)